MDIWDCFHSLSQSYGVYYHVYKVLSEFGMQYANLMLLLSHARVSGITLGHFPSTTWSFSGVYIVLLVARKILTTTPVGVRRQDVIDCEAWLP
jgi:hypothetical protein